MREGGREGKKGGEGRKEAIIIPWPYMYYLYIAKTFMLSLVFISVKKYHYQGS